MLVLSPCQAHVTASSRTLGYPYLSPTALTASLALRLSAPRCEPTQGRDCVQSSWASGFLAQASAHRKHSCTFWE